MSSHDRSRSKDRKGKEEDRHNRHSSRSHSRRDHSHSRGRSHSKTKNDHYRSSSANHQNKDSRDTRSKSRDRKDDQHYRTSSRSHSRRSNNNNNHDRNHSRGRSSNHQYSRSKDDRNGNNKHNTSRSRSMSRSHSHSRSHNNVGGRRDSGLKFDNKSPQTLPPSVDPAIISGLGLSNSKAYDSGRDIHKHNRRRDSGRHGHGGHRQYHSGNDIRHSPSRSHSHSGKPHTPITPITPITPDILHNHNHSSHHLHREHSHSHEYSHSASLQRPGFKQIHSVSLSHGGGTMGSGNNKFTIINVDQSPSNGNTINQLKNPNHNRSQSINTIKTVKTVGAQSVANSIKLKEKQQFNRAVHFEKNMKKARNWFVMGILSLIGFIFSMIYLGNSSADSRNGGGLMITVGILSLLCVLISCLSGFSARKEASEDPTVKENFGIQNT